MDVLEYLMGVVLVFCLTTLVVAFIFGGGWLWFCLGSLFITSKGFMAVWMVLWFILIYSLAQASYYP